MKWFNQVERVFHDFYKKLLGKQITHRCHISLEILQEGEVLIVKQQAEMYKPFSDKDIKVAIHSVANNKSPCPDGYASGFFQATWHIAPLYVMQ